MREQLDIYMRNDKYKMKHINFITKHIQGIVPYI